MTFTIELVGRGWVLAHLNHNGQELKIAGSRLSDCVSDVAHAAASLLNGSRKVEFAFQDEPGQHRFIVERLMEDQVKMTVIWNDQNFTYRPGTPVFTAECTVLDVVGQIFSSLHTMRERGEAEFASEWRYPFPQKVYAALKEKL